MSRARDTAEVAEEIDLKVDYSTPVNEQTGTSYTFELADARKLTTASSASAVTLTIPPQSEVTWENDTILRVVNYGAGAVTVAGGSGVTVTNTATTLAQFESAAAIRTGSDAWTLVPFGGKAKPPSLVEYLVIGGGGGGGGQANSNSHGGGGGAGGYRCSVSGENSGRNTSAEAPLVISPGTTYTVTVGAGGAGGNNSVGTKGSNSVFGSIISEGGGFGGSLTASPGTGGSGGGGGGGASVTQSGASGVSGQGFDGGNGTNVGQTSTSASGGGAGAGANGATGSNQGGAGGSGLASSITGTSVTRGGGGGGTGSNGGSGSNAAGGNGGGGRGTTTVSGGGLPGSANTGGGGGGGGYTTGINIPNAGGAGGKGVVIIRHPDTLAQATTTGSPIVSNPTGYIVYTFNDSGTIEWN